MVWECRWGDYAEQVMTPEIHPPGVARTALVTAHGCTNGKRKLVRVSSGMCYLPGSTLEGTVMGSRVSAG